MLEPTADDLVSCLKNNLPEEFKKEISVFLKTGNVIDFITKCTEDELKVAVDWCEEENIFLIHEVFGRIEHLSCIPCLKTFKYFNKFDSEKRTLLHVAVMHDRSIEVLKFLIHTKGLSIDSEDDYAYTPLHYYCQKDEYDTAVLRLLMKDPHQLTKQSKDGLTPLEFACSNEAKFDKLREIECVDIKELLRRIDNISRGITEMERFSVTTSFSTDRIWLNLLQKNDKYMLLSYIKNDETFADKYYLESKEILSIIRKSSENGQGILPFIKSRYFKNATEPKLCNILSELTGITIKERKKKRTFYKSALFLAFLTGRFQLISPLLRCCQFEIVSYSMLICLACKNFIAGNYFPDQVIKNIVELKDFCEEYSIAVMNSTYNKDLSEGKSVIMGYINRISERLDNKTIVEIAYHAKCIKFLGLPICQESLTHTWTKNDLTCPRIKFWVHSTTHILFLILFSYVVSNDLFSKMRYPEILCYVYGVGYFVEEIRQIHSMTKENFFHAYFTDPTNIIDMFAILSMFIGFLLRVSLHNPVSTEFGETKLLMESQDSHLFVQRLVLCLSLISYFMRVLYFAFLNQILGPKLKMISTMIMKDLVPIMFLFNIFIISFGVTFQSLLYPNGFHVKLDGVGSNATFARKSALSTVAEIFRRATFTIFNFQYTLNDIELSQASNLTDVNGLYSVNFLLLIFMLVVNVMLMNLLIAQFSNTVTQIIIGSKLSWKSSRYRFIHEYSERTILPPPLNIIAIPVEVFIYRLVEWVRKRDQRVLLVKDEEDTMLDSSVKENETPDEPSISYYIYQAFAMSGQRYRLLKDSNDVEYEKEVNFKLIKEKLKEDRFELKKTIIDKCNGIESAVKAQSGKKRYKTISTSVSLAE